MDPDSSGGWRFAQCFGDKGEVEDITEGRALPFHPPLETPLTGQTLSAADVISTVEFDSTGNYLATGDKGGRVVLFERNEQVRSFPFLRPSAFLRADWILSLNPFPSLFPSCRRRAVNTSFTQSSNHMSPSSIISIRLRSRRRLTRSSGVNDRMPLTFCCLPTVRVRDGVSYLPCSERSTECLSWIVSLDKTIKLWKVFEKSLRVVSESNHWDGQRSLPTPLSPLHLRLPKMTQQDNIIAAVPRKVYANAHAYHIHSISVNSDQETYISADDLRINLWNLNISDQSFSEWSRFPALRLPLMAYP